MDDTMTALKFGAEISVLPWGDESKVYIDLDGEALAIEKVMMDQSNGDIIIVATSND